MKGYMFILGFDDGFREYVTPAEKEGIYTDFEKGFKHLVELNHDIIVNSSYYDYDFFEKGYGIDFYPSNDKELAEAQEKENWELFDKLLEKHRMTDEKEINKKFVYYKNDDIECLPEDIYGLVEIEIF